MRFVMTALIGAAMLAVPAAAQAQQAKDVLDLWEGSCSAQSTANVRDNPSAPYPCNAMIHMAMAADPGHEMLIFVIKGTDGKQDGILIGLGGTLDTVGVLHIQRLQFTPGVSTPASRESSCVFTRAGKVLKRVVCRATAADGSGKAMSLDFAATNKLEPTGD